MTRLLVGVSVALGTMACVASLSQTELHQVTGKPRLLLAGDVERTYEDPPARTDQRVVVHLDTELEKTFELQLRTGPGESISRAMFDLLRDALTNNRTVTIDYSIESRRNRHIIHKVSLFGEPPPGVVRVAEVPQPVSTAEDSILQGERLDPSSVLNQLPNVPPEFEGKGAHDLLKSTKVTFLPEAEVAAGQTREISVSITEPVLLQARATWFGAVVPVDLRVSIEGKTVARGKAHSSPPNRGTATVDVQLSTLGSATVLFLNDGSEPIQVQMVVGLLPLSAAQGRTPR